ncbi:sister chromatid cohesion 1 protein 3 [Sesamum indicum]|uniref:Sister chromatid cohesion 1 protein 3 n=1 Tax=Sesamum indicum TaxID=4182 RepID=A0A6I9URW7_SESIN|nr:sister chromatid cohesion 1 protein 3 [Sesamum indicum]XP_011097495.1 sister chromatid cohesion 1 protein 3 [Sesamum indicum]XP_011097498.1 sister chromatid cohesion 1 protein 3 [Sesamum indicum]XP_020554273.1 sister chromatid cohesion 1 protein 3 [Sesamum indicum]XP_020554274.1 sister chromatid cohesion 1 protein 3 [Sesamum indicum]XP_020554275.1 sister chromatid cohesion 1 protein 3 [Sesamum indicum]
MFYSHTFLARKGPLGTVWCAAHLQHKLKKSHYVSTNVPSTVERIMYPEVPIALRMSGHLLLGVVRIYSKQVDYLYEDCNGVRNTINRVFTSVNVNLPDDAKHAPFHAITLPEKFELDSLELDDYDKDLCEDSYLKSKDEITLSEQIPTGQDQYVVIRVDEYDFRASSFMEDNSRSGPVPMEEDIPLPVEVDSTAGSENPSPPNQLAADDGNIGNSSPQDLPSIEIMRDARHGFDFNNSPILPDRVDPDKFLEEQIIKDKVNCTPVTEEVLLPDDRFSSPQNHEEQHSLRHLDSPMLFVHQSPEMEIQPTPPVAQRIVRKRKRKQYFDKSPVLSNKHVKKALDDTNDTRRNRRNCPLSSLAIFKQNMRLQLKKNGLPRQPYVTGCCPALLSLYEEGNISVHHMVTTEKTPQEMSADQALSPSHDRDREIEVLRNNEGASPDRFMPSFSMAVPSPHGRSYLTPENSSFGLQSECLETTEGDRVLPTSDVGTSPRDIDSEMRTPDTFYGKGLPERTALSDIPELASSAEELGFLEQDDNSPAGSQGTPEFGIFSYNQGTPELQALSSRTRAVAQYLKKQSSITPTSGNSQESSEDLSLNKILEGKPKKICARMFYETLVLKNYGLVDVHQENPYDDVSLKVTPKLSKGQYSG